MLVKFWVIGGSAALCVAGCEQADDDPGSATGGGGGSAAAAGALSGGAGSGGSSTGGAPASAGQTATGGAGATAGQTATGGAGASAGRAGVTTGGTASGMGSGAGRGGSSGGRAPTAGTSNTPGGAAGESGEGPQGTVDYCDGPGCPYGECDPIFGDDCAEVYPGPLDASSKLCAAGNEGSYCLTVVNDSVDNFAVSCSGGVAEAVDCGNYGCGIAGSNPAKCGGS